MSDDKQDGETSGTRRSPWTLAAVALGCAAVLIALAAVAGWRWAALDADNGADDNQAFVDQSATAEAAESAQDIVQGVFTYDYEDMDTYRDALNRYLDEDMLEEYQQTADQNEQIITEAKTVVEATVERADVGIAELDDDRASAVLIMSRDGANDEDQDVADAAPLRLSMVKVDGDWKASNISLL